MSRYGLNLEKNKRRGSGSKTRYIVAFLCFALILGAFSFLLLWKSLNYDFNNIFKSGDESTEEVTTTQPAVRKQFEGRCVFAAGVTDDAKKKLLFAQLISVDLSEKTVRVVPVASDRKKGDVTVSEAAVKGGQSFKQILSSLYGEEISRYVLLTESQYKAVFRTMGNIRLTVPASVEYDTDDMFLELSKGENELTPEKTGKYMKYLCETLGKDDAAQMNAKITVAAFNAFFTAEKFISADYLFEKLINYCTSDITIVDYTESKEKIESLVPVSSKDSLKVFVSKSLKEITDEE